MELHIVAEDNEAIAGKAVGDQVNLTVTGSVSEIGEDGMITIEAKKLDVKENLAEKTMKGMMKKNVMPAGEPTAASMMGAEE